MTHKTIVIVFVAIVGAQLAAVDRDSQALASRSVTPNTRADTGPATRDPADVDRFVAALLVKMSLDEKIGQMIQADIASIEPADLRRYKLGSVLAGGNAAPGNVVRTTPQAWLDLTDAFHAAALADSREQAPRRLASIPLLFGIDAVHGHAKVVGATIFPHNVGLGAAHDPDLIRRIGRATSAEVSATGIDWTFAPTVAVARDPRWGRSYESYSELPALVAQYAAAMVTGLQGQKGTADFMAQGHTLSSVKHFVGDGATLAGRDQGNALVTEAQLLGVHAAGYPAAIDAGALIVMASYNSWQGVKSHANHYLLSEVLKGRMGFTGFVVGDWNAHEQIPGCTKADCPAAILAGVDMLMAPDAWKELYDNTLAEARSGEIPQARIDDAVRRILRVKAVAGLFSSQPQAHRNAGQFAELGSPAHRLIAREAVRKSLVLLKNEHDLLPLDPHAHVLVSGAGSDDIGMQCGGWTLDWQGDRNSNADFPGATSVYAGIRAAVTHAGGTAVLSPDGRFADKPDVAIVVFGERPYAEFQGDRETLEFSPGNKAGLALLRRLRAAGIPTVGVFLSGRPLWVNPEINAAEAFVAAWLPGSEGEGIADVLFRAADGSIGYDFVGRLAFSWPATAMPATFDPAGHASGALFADGFGLGYRAASPARMLSEEPRIAAYFEAPRGSLFHAGHPTAPWSLFVADGADEVHVTSAQQASPHGAVVVRLGPDGAAARWNGTREAMLRLSGHAADLRSGSSVGSAVELHYRLDQRAARPVAIGVRCTDPKCGTAQGAWLDASRYFENAKLGVWQTLAIPFACFAAIGAELGSVEVPFTLATAGRFGVTIRDVRLVAPPMPAAPAPCPAAASSLR